ncbi:hypothetical protein AAVH_06495 [Aphelenchoides avenae]|nr:hypothetical protein AAVH_06495 [Aphelenchus avenae]
MSAYMPSLAHEECQYELGLDFVPQLLSKVNEGCSVNVALRALACGLGLKFTNPLDVRLRDQSGNKSRPSWRRNRKLAMRVRRLVTHSNRRPKDVDKFRQQLLPEMQSGGLDVLKVLQRILACCLKPVDAERMFEIRLEKVKVCPSCGHIKQMKMSSKAGSRVFFAFSTNNGVYSETWKATVGKPWKHFGFTGETWPTKECGKKRGGCGRTFEGDEALWPVKERVDWPSDPTNRPSEDNPRYIIVSYMAEGAGTCATVSDRSEDSSASSGHMANLKVTPQPHDSFHAVRIEPGLRRGSTVFDTSRQLHYDLVGYARYNDSKDHVVWRQHSEHDDAHYQMDATEEGDQLFLKISREAYWEAGQPIAFALFRSTGKSDTEQPRSFEKEWAAGPNDHDAGTEEEEEDESEEADSGEDLSDESDDDR